MTKKNFLIAASAFIIFSLAAILLTYPLIFHLGDISTGVGDELVIAWIQNWVIHELTSGNISTLFNANTYFPYNNTLAYSETFLTSSVLSSISLKFINEPIATVNFTLISSIILLGFSIFILSYYLTKDYFISLLAGILIIFSPAVLDKTTHLQILSIHWVPLSILFFLIFIKSKSSKYLALSLLLFLIQMHNSFLPGYFIIFSLIIIFIYNFIYLRNKTKKLINSKNISLIMLTCLLIAPVIIPYYKVSKEFGYTRDIRDSIHFALQPEDLLYSSNHSRLSIFLNNLPINKKSQNNEFKPGYLGLVFSLLTIFTLYHFFKNFKKNGLIFNTFTTIALTGLILSLGPALHLGRQTIHVPFPIPLPYALFYYILPGFQGFRNSARWEMLFIISIVIALSIILQTTLKKLSKLQRISVCLVLIILSILEFNFPMKFVVIPKRSEFPESIQWLSTTKPDSASIIMPIYNWNMPYSGVEIMRQYYSTIHFRKTVNGYSGFSPPAWQNFIYEMMEDFPKDKSITKLKKIGINYIIVRKKEYDQLSKDKFRPGKNRIPKGFEIISALSKNKEVHLIKKINEDYIYAL